MKIMFYFIFMFAFTPPAFSQSDISLETDLSTSEINESDENKIAVKDSTKDYTVFRKRLDDLYKNKIMIKVIPIPPATASNSKVELLPLYRPGKAFFKFLYNQQSDTNRISQR